MSKVLYHSKANRSAIDQDKCRLDDHLGRSRSDVFVMFSDGSYMPQAGATVNPHKTFKLPSHLLSSFLMDVWLSKISVCPTQFTSSSPCVQMSHLHEHFKGLVYLSTWFVVYLLQFN